MLVTVYTDASFKEGKASWAAYVKSNEGVLKLHDRIMTSVNGPAHAEIIAVKQALYAVLRNEWNVNIFFVNTDCMAVCHAFWPWMNQGNSAINQIADECTSLAKKHDITIRVKHVKAHTNKDDVRSYLNRWCDKHAKKHRPK